MKYRFALASFGIALTIFVAGCATPSSSPPVRSSSPPRTSQGHGPPPHAPAHGYRHKHKDGRDLRYDKGLGVYVVVGSTEVYFSEGRYIRISGDSWEVSVGTTGPWEPVIVESIPPGLKKKHGKGKKKPGKKGGKGKGKGKGKKN